MNDIQTAVESVRETELRTPRSMAHQARRLVLALFVAAVAMIGLTVSPASAWTAVSAGGVYGGVTPRGVQGTSVYYKVPTALYGSMVPSINVTGPLATRSNAWAGTQLVDYRFTLWQHNGSTWVAAYHSWTTTIALAPGQTANFNPQDVRVSRGYYRVTFAVSWRDQYGRALGSRNFDYNHASDYRCLVGGCLVGPGWILHG